MARIVSLKKNMGESMSAAQCWYKKDFGWNVRALSTLRVCQFVYVNNSPRAVLACEADKAATASHNKQMPRVSGPHKIVTVRDHTLTVLEVGIKNTISIDYATKASGLSEEPDTNGDAHNTRELSHTQANEMDSKDHDKVIADKIVRHVT